MTVSNAIVSFIVLVLGRLAWTGSVKAGIGLGT